MLNIFCLLELLEYFPQEYGSYKIGREVAKEMLLCTPLLFGYRKNQGACEWNGKERKGRVRIGIE